MAFLSSWWGGLLVGWFLGIVGMLIMWLCSNYAKKRDADGLTWERDEAVRMLRTTTARINESNQREIK